MEPQYQECTKHHRCNECSNQIKKIEQGGGKILAVKRAKNQELVLIYRSSQLIDADPDIYAYVFPQEPNAKPLHLAVYVFYEVEKKEFFIADIHIHFKDYNKGYGSLLMEQLLQIAKKENIKVITGNISSIDWNHFERIRHFYQKYGFSVELDYKKRSGKIKRLFSFSDTQS